MLIALSVSVTCAMTNARTLTRKTIQRNRYRRHFLAYLQCDIQFHTVYIIDG